MLGKYIVGLMSGSSLDGLDVALIHFPSDFYQTKQWSLMQGETLAYNDKWLTLLQNANKKNHQDIHQKFGKYLGQLVKDYLQPLTIEPDLIAVHGHTLQHEPQNKLSIQLGAAQAIANVTGIPSMDDFRIQDILLGGQGAPLAPTVEHWLFPNHSVFLNIGGIVNLSYHRKEEIIAFDIGPGNQLLNCLANEVDQPFDKNGELAKRGKVHQSLLQKAKENEFYGSPYPKSLSNQWVQHEVIPLFQKNGTSLEDRMATAVALISWTLKNAIDQIGINNQRILITGGGAYNSELVLRLRESITTSHNSIEIPDHQIIDFKEATLMALMGYLNITGSNNVFGQSTGSKINHCAGNLCVPKSFPLV